LLELGGGLTRGNRLQRLAPGIGALLLFGVLTALMLELRPAYLGRRLPSDLGDPVLNLYFLEWGEKEITQGLDGFWDANFFFPATGVMTFADHMLGPAGVAVLFRQVWDNGVAAYDFLFCASFVLCAATVAWVLRQAGASRPAAVIAGLMFAFSPYRFDQRAHLPMLLAQWIPLVLSHWNRLLSAPSWRPAIAFCGFYVLHVTGGTYLSHLMHLALAIVLVVHWRDWRALVSPRSLAVLIPVALVGGAVTLAIFQPYVEVHRQLGLERSPDGIRFYGATLGSWLSVERGNYVLGWLQRLGGPENNLFAGFVTTGFAAAGALAMLRARAARRGPELARGEPGPDRERLLWDRALIAIGVFFFLLSFSWFYLPLSQVVPGLSGMRVPTRGYPFVSLALVALAAKGVDRLLDRAPRRFTRGLWGTAIGVVLLFELRSDMPWRRWPLPDTELGIYHEIARRGDVRAVLHLPIPNDPWDARYMYFSTLHWKPIANGYSGYAPAAYVELRRRLHERPLDEGTIDYLIDLGVTHVATHPPPLQPNKLVQRAGVEWKLLGIWERHFASERARRLKLVASVGDDRLYQLLPPPGASS
jgi:hypothetical protein